MNPYVLLAQVGATIALVVGTWVYRGHLCDIEIKAKLDEERNNEYATMLAYERSNALASTRASDKAKADQYAYQSSLAAANARAAAADDTSSRLQHAFTLYADGGWFKTPGEATSCIPVSEANSRLGLLAHDASILDADGLRASKGAAECAVRLTACENWSRTVEEEFGK